MNEVGAPVPGFYRMKLISGGPWVAVHLYYGPPPDPHQEDAPALDRSPRWITYIAGREVATIWRAWPACSGEPISREEYDHILAKAAWARRHDPAAPEASPRQPVDWKTARVVFD